MVICDFNVIAGYWVCSRCGKGIIYNKRKKSPQIECCTQFGNVWKPSEELEFCPQPEEMPVGHALLIRGRCYQFSESDPILNSNDAYPIIVLQPAHAATPTNPEDPTNPQIPIHNVFGYKAPLNATFMAVWCFPLERWELIQVSC